MSVWAWTRMCKQANALVGLWAHTREAFGSRLSWKAGVGLH